MHSCPLGPTELFGHGRRYVLLPQPRPDLGMLPEQVEEVWARVCSRAKSLLPQGQVEPWAHMFGTVALAPRTHPGRREVVYGGQCLVILRSLLEVVRDLAVDHGLRAQAQSLDPLVETEVFLEPCLDGHRPAAHPHHRGGTHRGHSTPTRSWPIRSRTGCKDPIPRNGWRSWSVPSVITYRS